MARPFLAADPGPSTLRWGWFLWVSWAVVGMGLLGEDRDGNGFALALVLSAPFWALWLLWPVYRGWAVWWRWAQRSRRDERPGCFYEFDGQQVRILFDDDRIWFAADDVFDALGLDGRQRDAERGRIMAGPDGLSAEPRTGLPAFSERSLAAWLGPRTEPDAVKFRRWVELQVIEPFRRRREQRGL